MSQIYYESDNLTISGWKYEARWGSLTTEWSLVYSSENYDKDPIQMFQLIFTVLVNGKQKSFGNEYVLTVSKDKDLWNLDLLSWESWNSTLQVLRWLWYLNDLHSKEIREWINSWVTWVMKQLYCPDCEKVTDTEVYNDKVHPNILNCAECLQFVQQ